MYISKSTFLVSYYFDFEKSQNGKTFYIYTQQGNVYQAFEWTKQFLTIGILYFYIDFLILLIIY
jgi:hypothetical protein